MPIRKTSRAIVVHNNAVLLIERWRGDDHYFALPGGGIEPGETPEVAVVRELFEETKVLVRPRFVVAKDRTAQAQHTYLLCDFLSGEPELPAESTANNNRYKPCWLSAAEFAALPESQFNTKLRLLVTEILSGQLPAAL